MTQLVESLKWRYATKKMDASKKVDEKDIDYIKEAIQLTATSYGLQPFKVLDIRDQNVRASLQPISWNQSQITDASHLFVFTSQLTVADQDNYLEMKAKTSNMDVAQLAGYGDFVKAKMKEKSEIEMKHWTEKQAYIALSSALIACAELKIDATPIEGFEPDAYNNTLGLTDKGLNASVVLAIGYRHEDDEYKAAPKVRKSVNQLFDTV